MPLSGAGCNDILFVRGMWGIRLGAGMARGAFPNSEDGIRNSEEGIGQRAWCKGQRAWRIEKKGFGICDFGKAKSILKNHVFP